MPIERETHTWAPALSEVVSLLGDLLIEVRAVRGLLENPRENAPVPSVPLVPPRSQRDRADRERYLRIIDGHPCSHCRAQPGENCRTPRGREVWPPHIERLRRGGGLLP
jgi:hypothetical protein